MIFLARKKFPDKKFCRRAGLAAGFARLIFHAKTSGGKGVFPRGIARCRGHHRHLSGDFVSVFARARENARRSSCQSNLKQIGLGALQYTQDYDETLFRSFYGSATADSDATTNYKWMDAIFPYVKNEGVFVCPSDAKMTYHFRDGRNYGSYGLNGAYNALGDAFTPPRSGNGLLVSWSRIGIPAETVWVCDNANAPSAANPGGSQGFYWATPATNPTISNGSPRQLQNIVERHLDFTNVLFCDGHVKALKLDALARTKTIGAEQVMTLFTIEDD